MKKLAFLMSASLLTSSLTMAQFRATDKDGINVFETPKTEVMPFDGVKVKIGGAFTQSWQALKDANTATPVSATNTLYSIKPGFNTANANLNFNVALAEGVDLKMDMYLSSRHHNETWVKGGYIQFNKFPFLKSLLIDNIMKYTTLKVGHMEINYGDAHYRRSDNGNSIYNPFVENYIMDAFATEIGLEADVQHNGFIGVVGVTNGEIKGDLSDIDEKKDSASTGSRNPAFLAKLGYDNKITEKLRVRLTGSVYTTAGSYANTLYYGDRTGSHYFLVMEQSSSVIADATKTAFSGRFTPGFTDKVTSYMGNLMLKYDLMTGLSLESFSTYEKSNGRSKSEIWGERDAKQFATDLVVRFGKGENFWLGGRYNKVDASLYNVNATVNPAIATKYDVSIDRVAVSGGWFMTKNIMAKVEYTKQKYDGFLAKDIRHGGKFNGLVVEAVVGF